MSVIMGTAARIEPGPKSFWGLNWLQNQDFGQSITKARKVGIMRKEKFSYFPDEMVIYDAHEATGDFVTYETISFFTLCQMRLGTVRSCALDHTHNTLVFGLRKSLMARAKIKDEARTNGVKDIESSKTFAISAYPVRFVAFLTPDQFVAQGERTLKVCSRISEQQ